MRGAYSLGFSNDQHKKRERKMDVSAPESLEHFTKVFPNWPEDSLSRRIDRIGSGNSWGIREIGTFQVLRTPPTGDIPPFLKDYWAESENRVAGNVALQTLFELLNRDWRSMNHEQIQKAAGPFASFLSALSQVMEDPITADSDRLMRDRFQSRLDDIGSDPNIPASDSSNSQETPPPFSSSPPEYPRKRLRPDRSSGSYVPSDPESDQSIYDQRAKSEFATNFCIYELLRCVTELSRKTTDSSHKVEWGIVPNTFEVKAGQHQFSSTNDGGLVNKATRSGQWQRVSDICYCSVEVCRWCPNFLNFILMFYPQAKSWYNASGKLEKVKAQEAAHLIGMFSQRI